MVGEPRESSLVRFNAISPRLEYDRKSYGSCSRACGMLDGPLCLDPSSTVFHYAQCLFEGMKAYRDTNGKVSIFRPDMNMSRMNRSAQRIALPVCEFTVAVSCPEVSLALDIRRSSPH